MLLHPVDHILLGYLHPVAYFRLVKRVAHVHLFQGLKRFFHYLRGVVSLFHCFQSPQLFRDNGIHHIFFFCVRIVYLAVNLRSKLEALAEFVNGNFLGTDLRDNRIFLRKQRGAGHQNNYKSINQFFVYHI